jgi:hypothetical protein
MTLAVMENENFPLGMIDGVSESYGIYDHFFGAMISTSRQPLRSSKVIATIAVTYQALLTKQNTHGSPCDLVAEGEGERHLGQVL